MQPPKTGSITESSVYSLYETDFYAWTQTQADLLRHRHWNQLDLPNLIEEIESLGKQQRAELRNRLKVLIGHLLKWEYQPEQRSRSWFITIRIQRHDIQDLLEENPSLKPYLQEAVQTIYASGKDLAAAETNLPLRTFPQSCPYLLEDIFSDRFYPGEPAPDQFLE
jgi:hypothetical protein